jgi:hypothetical protein
VSAEKPRNDAPAWPRREFALAGVVYLLFFALLFLPLPLRGELPGNCDTWLNGIALPNLMFNRVRAAWTGEEVGTPLYPETNVFAYGESSPGTAALFGLLKLATGDDVSAYYVFVVLLLTLNAFGVFLLARWYVTDRTVAVFAGLAFAASNYTLGNIDSPHTSFFLLAFACLDQWKRYLETKDHSALVAAVLLGGAQAYFSAYLFLFQSLAACGMLLHHRRVCRPRGSREAVRVLVAGGCYLALAAPFFAFYLSEARTANFGNPWAPMFLAEVHSLEPADLLRSLENNRIYPFDRVVVAGEIARRTQAMIRAGILELEDLTNEDAATVLGKLSTPEDPKYFVYTRRCAFLGFVLYALAGVGMMHAPLRTELLVLYGGALVVSFGPLIWWGDLMMPNVMLPLYRLGVASVLRVPSRAFAFAVLALVLLASIGLERIASHRARWKRRLLYGLATAAVLAENVPVPMKSFAGRSLATPAPLVLEFFAGKRGFVVLDLPSRPGGALFRDSSDLFEWNREILYMNHQTYHLQSTVNGVHGYFPRSRLAVQHLIDALPSPEALEGLRAIGVQFIVYHRALELPWEVGLYQKLARSSALDAVGSSPEVTIFRIADEVDHSR